MKETLRILQQQKRIVEWMHTYKGLPELLESKLMRSGVNVNAQNSAGNTPLMLAIYNLNNTIDYHIEAGADVNTKNDKGETALMLDSLSQNHVREPIPAQIYIKRE